MNKLPVELLLEILDASTFVNDALRTDSGVFSWALERDLPPRAPRKEFLVSIRRATRTASRIILVCKQWHSLGIDLLFRHAIASFKPRKAPRWLRFLDNQSPQTASLQQHGTAVRRLDIEFEPLSLTLADSEANADAFWQAVFRFVERCPNLQIVTTGNASSPPTRLWQEVRRSSFSSIQFLCAERRVCGPYVDIRRVGQAFNGAPSLRSVMLLGTSFQDRPLTPDPLHLPCLESYVYLGIVQDIRLPSLHQMTLDWIFIREFLDDHNFICSHGSLIRDLHIYISTDHIDVEDATTVLSRIPTLRYLCISFSRWSWAYRVLSSLDISRAKIQVLGVNYDSYSCQRPYLDYSELFRHISESQLSSGLKPEVGVAIRFVGERLSRDVRKHGRRLRKIVQELGGQGFRLEAFDGNPLFA